MNKQVELEARIAKFASRLWVGGVPLGDACIIAEQVMNPQLPGYVERGPFGMHQPCGDDQGIYNDDSSSWDGLNY